MDSYKTKDLEIQKQQQQIQVLDQYVQEQNKRISLLESAISDQQEQIKIWFKTVQDLQQVPPAPRKIDFLTIPPDVQAMLQNPPSGALILAIVP